MTTKKKSAWFTPEAKTGLIVLGSLAMLLVVLLRIGNFGVLQKGYVIKAQFHNTAGIKKHAPVRLSGVDVGEVKDIEVHYGDQTLVDLVLFIHEGVRVRMDSKAYVTTLGMMGEKYIEIVAGTAGAEYAKEGETIPAVDPVRLEDLIQTATKVGEDISQMAKDISSVAKNVDKTITENKPKIGNMFDNFEETSENFRDFSQDIKFHPWKVLMKGKERSKEELAKERAERLAKKENPA